MIGRCRENKEVLPGIEQGVACIAFGPFQVAAAEDEERLDRK